MKQHYKREMQQRQIWEHSKPSQRWLTIFFVFQQKISDRRGIFEGPDPYSPVCRHKRMHLTASYRHILIYVHVFLGFSNSEGASLLLLYPSSSTRTSPSTRGSFSPSLVNIWGDQKGCSQSFPQIKVLCNMFQFPVQALILKKPALFHMMEGVLLTEKTGYFCSFDFLLARMYMD